MEKLKAKHDHKLTDILKVFIFGLFLIMPFLVFAPALLYISFNQNAQAEENTINVDEYKQVDFNQQIQNTNNSWYPNIYTYDNNNGYYVVNSNENVLTRLQQNQNYELGHKIYYSLSILNDYDENSSVYAGSYGIDNVIEGNRYAQYSTQWQTLKFIAYTDSEMSFSFLIGRNELGSFSFKFKDYMAVDLTQMFGEGNEPTISQFNQWYTNEYYEYTLSKPEVIKIGTSTETIQDVETQIANNWQQMWNKQIFKWTNETILYKGINAFSQTFGIFDNSYITNLITYELIIVMIYIVIDIILTMFKWLTHMIGEK